MNDPCKYAVIAIGRILPDCVQADALYLKMLYRFSMHKSLNLRNPKTFNEKLQWLKLYDRKLEYTNMVDKYEVKKYISEKIGEQYVIPTLGVWDSFNEIDFDKLPNQFVLKTTHDSGGVVICADKKKFDVCKAKKVLEHSLKRRYFLNTREWPYKNVKPRIIAEKYMVDESGYELKDYKFFCFNGEPKLMFVASDRQVYGEETKFDFFDMEFKHLKFENGHPNSNKALRCPDSFETMKKFARELSKGIPHLRVDFYDINGNVYFGELTFSHWSGMVAFNPEEWDEKIGRWIKLPEVLGGGDVCSIKVKRITLLLQDVTWLHTKTNKIGGNFSHYKESYFRTYKFKINNYPRHQVRCFG